MNINSQTVDTSSPMGKFFITIMVRAAERENNLIKERFSNGSEAIRAEGKIIGSLPYGYRLGNDGKTLIEEPIEHEALQLIHELETSGHSLREIAAELNAQGYTTKKGGTWTHGHVQGILRRSA